MNYITALIVCKISGTPIKFGELLNLRKNKKELEPFLRAIIQLHKGNVNYDRKNLTDYYLNKGNIENVSHGLVIAKVGGKILSLQEAIEKDKKGIDFIKQFEKNKT